MKRPGVAAALLLLGTLSGSCSRSAEGTNPHPSTAPASVSASPRSDAGGAIVLENVSRTILPAYKFYGARRNLTSPYFAPWVHGFAWDIKHFDNRDQPAPVIQCLHDLPPDRRVLEIQGADIGFYKAATEPDDFATYGGKQWSVTECPADLVTDPVTGKKFGGLWYDHGIPQVRKQAREYFKAIYDGFVALHDPHPELAVTHLAQDMCEGYFQMEGATPERVRAIKSDPRYPAWIKAKGLPDFRAKPGDYYAVPASYEKFAIDNAVREDIVQVLKAICWDAAREFFPHVTMGNYGYAGTSQANGRRAPNHWGDAYYYDKTWILTTQDPELYPWRMPNQLISDGFPPRFETKAYAGDNPGPIWDTPYHRTVQLVNRARSVMLMHPNVQVMPWYMGINSAPGQMGTADNQPLNDAWWVEVVIHVALSTASTRGYTFEYTDQKDADNLTAAFDGIKNALGSLDDFSTPLVSDLADYHAPYLVSTVITESGKTLGRVTFQPGINTASFEIRGTPVTVTRRGSELGAFFTLPAGADGKSNR